MSTIWKKEDNKVEKVKLVASVGPKPTTSRPYYTTTTPKPKPKPKPKKKVQEEELCPIEFDHHDLVFLSVIRKPKTIIPLVLPSNLVSLSFLVPKQWKSLMKIKMAKLKVMHGKRGIYLNIKPEAKALLPPLRKDDIYTLTVLTKGYKGKLIVKSFIVKEISETLPGLPSYNH